ncbi:MAG: hypothetical protein JST65_11295, partial [Acidobacteria bacterium]|nr:hypothetical protein [Acidobacteriota bacterium]
MSFFARIFLFLFVVCWYPALGQSITLSFRALDAGYSASLERLILISSSPSNTLHILNPATGTSETVALSGIPSSLSVSEDGLRAAVLLPETIAYIDLTTRTVLREYSVTAVPVNRRARVLLKNEWL